MIDLVLDIETVPGPMARTDPEKFLRPYDRRRLQRGEITLEQFTNGLGLSPGTGQIICIGCCVRVRNEPGALPLHQSFYGGSERRVLDGFWKFAHGVNPFEPGGFRLITFNGRAFDVPYVLLRSAIIGVKPTCALDRDHVDLYELLSTDNFKQVGGSLAFWLNAFGLPAKRLAGGGDDVFALFDGGNWDEISAYCETDCTRTLQLFDRVEPVLPDLLR